MAAQMSPFQTSGQDPSLQNAQSQQQYPTSSETGNGLSQAPYSPYTSAYSDQDHRGFFNGEGYNPVQYSPYGGGDTGGYGTAPVPYPTSGQSQPGGMTYPQPYPTQYPNPYPVQYGGGTPDQPDQRRPYPAKYPGQSPTQPFPGDTGASPGYPSSPAFGAPIFQSWPVMRGGGSPPLGGWAPTAGRGPVSLPGGPQPYQPAPGSVPYPSQYNPMPAAPPQSIQEFMSAPTPGPTYSSSPPTAGRGPVTAGGGPQAINPGMSQGAPPWATYLNGTQSMPGAMGQSSLPFASAQQWNTFLPQEQQAILQTAQSVGIDPQAYMQQMGKLNPQWGYSPQAQYQSF